MAMSDVWTDSRHDWICVVAGGTAEGRAVVTDSARREKRRGPVEDPTSRKKFRWIEK